MSYARPTSAKRLPAAASAPAAAVDFGASASTKRPTSAAPKRPTSGATSRPLSAASRGSSPTRRRANPLAGGEATDAADRVAQNVQSLKALLHHRSRPLNPALLGPGPTFGDIARQRPLSAATTAASSKGRPLSAAHRRAAGGDGGRGLLSPRRGDHLMLHRRPWGPGELEARVEGFGTHRVGSSAARSRVAASVALREIDAFNKAHRADAPDADEDDDEERAAREAEDRAAARRAGLLTANGSAPPSRPRSRTANPVAHSKKVQVTLVQAESVLMRYLVVLDRAVAVSRRGVPTEVFRRLHAALLRAPTEPVTRAGHESFKAMRQATVLDRATGPQAQPQPSQGGAAIASPMLSAALPPGSAAVSGPYSPSSQGLATPVASGTPGGAGTFAKSPPTAGASPNTAALAGSGRSGKAVPGAGIPKATAATIYDALDVYHEGWVAARPAQQALAFVCGRRSAADVIFYALTALSAHGSSVTPMDLLALHRFALMSEEALRTQALTMAALGRGVAASSSALSMPSTLGGSGVGGPTAGVAATSPWAGRGGQLLEEVLLAKATVFTPERESMLWAEFSDALDLQPRLATLAACALAAAAPPA